MCFKQLTDLRVTQSGSKDTSGTLSYAAKPERRRWGHQQGEVEEWGKTQSRVLLLITLVHNLPCRIVSFDVT